MTPLFKKLNYKGQSTLYVLHAPPGFKPEAQAMSPVASIKTSLAGAKKIEFVIAFVSTQEAVDRLATTMLPLLADDGVVWFAYPKATSKNYTCEFNRDNGWALLGRLGFEGVRMVAIDEDWSALRFRRATHIRTMTRKFAMSEEGKKKTAAARQGKKTR